MAMTENPFAEGPHALDAIEDTNGLRNMKFR